jgi:hypothetical protein
MATHCATGVRSPAGATLSTRAVGSGVGFGTGLGLVAQILFCSGPGSNVSNQTQTRTLRALCVCETLFFFCEGNVVLVCCHLVLLTHSGSVYKPHRFVSLGIFLAAGPEK